MGDNKEKVMQIEDNNDKSGDDDDGEGDTGEDSGHVGRKPMNGPPCSLKTLLEDGILKAGSECLSIEYMSARFTADLLPNGKIRWTENKQVFNTPSAWVNHCKKIVNPDNKSGSAWSCIRYEGKRLDSYKLRWYRKQKKSVGSNKCDNSMEFGQDNQQPQENSFFTSEMIANLIASTSGINNGNSKTLNDVNVVEHEKLGNRKTGGLIEGCDAKKMVQCTPFSALQRIQPFTMTLSTNALLLIDFHCHLTHGEVVGYLGGTWDIASHNLSIMQAFPCRSRLGDKDNSSLVEEEIRQALERRHLNNVGWYHSHPNAAPQPTLRDIDSQMEYQIAMKGDSDSSYTPCVSLICSPFYEHNDSSGASLQVYWVMPPPESKPHEYGKPMKMTYTVSRDAFLTQDLLLEMRLLAHFYSGSPDFVTAKQQAKETECFWKKLQISLQSKLPRDLQTVDGQSSSQSQVQQQALTHFWAFLKGLVLP